MQTITNSTHWHSIHQIEHDAVWLNNEISGKAMQQHTVVCHWTVSSCSNSVYLILLMFAIGSP